MATPNYDIDYNDKRLTDVKAAEKSELNKSDVEFGNMIANTDKIYQQQIDNSEQWEKTQTDIQNQKTDFAIDEINQQKAQTKKDYTKEQAGAYVDWQKQSDPYGVAAEQAAAMGMQNGGYRESMMVSMYNTYQNRIATAREAYIQVVQDYDNAITEARLNNSSILAEIAQKAQEQRLQLALESLQYKNELLQKKADRKLQIQQIFHTKYQDVLDQMNKENALAEEVRQADMANARQQEQIKIAQQELQLQKDKFAYEKAQDAKAATISNGSGGGGGGNSGGSGSKGGSGGSASGISGSGGSSKSNDTYNKAAENLKNQGAIKAGDGGLMTKTEWLRRKNSGSNRAEFGFATYQDYVNSFSAWRLANPEK